MTELFWGTVFPRSHHYAGFGAHAFPIVQFLGNAKIEHHRTASVVLDHDIGRLNIAMNDGGGLVMGIIQRARHLPSNFEHLRQRQGALLIDVLLEGPSLDVFHDKITQVKGVISPRAQHSCDVAVLQPCHEGGFLLETGDHILVFKQEGRKCF